MDQASCSIADSLRDVGIETFRHAVFGTGLLTGTVDWLARTRQNLQAEKPDVVVAIFVGNYWPPPLRDANGSVIEVNTPAFYRAWQYHAQLLSAEVHAAHARMYWVSPGLARRRSSIPCSVTRAACSTVTELSAATMGCCREGCWPDRTAARSPRNRRVVGGA